MSNHLKTIIDLQNTIVKQNEHFKNFTTVMMKTIVEKDNEIHRQHIKYISLEKNVMSKIENQQIMIDRIKHGLEVNSTITAPETSLVDAPMCNLCHKTKVTDKYKMNRKFKTRCTNCLFKARKFEANTKRKRLIQEQLNSESL